MKEGDRVRVKRTGQVGTIRGVIEPRSYTVVLDRTAEETIRIARPDDPPLWTSFVRVFADSDLEVIED